MRISFELYEDDLKHFRLIMQEARQAASRLQPEDIIASAEDLLKNVEESKTPGFIVDRLIKIGRAHV